MVANRAMYREKFAQVTPMLSAVMDVALPDAGFYLWAGIPEAFKGSDTAFSRELLRSYNVVVLPGSYLARDAQGTIPAPAESAWRWWQKPPNAWKRRSASFSSSNPKFTTTRPKPT